MRGWTWLLLIPLLALQGRERARLDAFFAATQPIGAQRRTAYLAVDGLTLGRGVWIQDGDQAHLAFRDPLGTPRVVVRVASGAVGVEMVGEREVVAADAALVLEEMFASTPAVWAQVVWGRLPGRWRGASPGEVAVSVGAAHTAVNGPGLQALLDVDGRVERAAAAGWIAHRTVEEPSGTERVELRHAERRSKVVLTLGPAAAIETPLPDHVFRIASGHRSPTASVEYLTALAQQAAVKAMGDPESPVDAGGSEEPRAVREGEGTGL